VEHLEGQDVETVEVTERLVDLLWLVQDELALRAGLLPVRGTPREVSTGLMRRRSLGVERPAERKERAAGTSIPALHAKLAVAKQVG
jgi:hypothetical protein